MLKRRRAKEKRVNIHDAKTHLSRLIERVEEGESVTICRAGQPVAKLVAVNGNEQQPKRSMFGYAKGKIWYTDDCFDPLSEEELKAWYDAPLMHEPRESVRRSRGSKK